MIATCTYKDLEEITNGFSEENFIGKFQFGKVYRGFWFEQEVTVKIWEEDALIYKVYPGDNDGRLKDEVDFLRHNQNRLKPHPNLVKLIRYTYEGEKPGVIYDLQSLDTVHNLLCKDDFTWPQRIKVALGFARLLEFMHTGNAPYLPYLVRNIDAAHVMLDREYNPILFDFSMISGGILTDKRHLVNQYVHGCDGYIDPYPNYTHKDRWSRKCDVFAFGVVLLGLITKRVFTEEDRISGAPFVFEWAQSEYNRQKSISGFELCNFSLVPESLEVGPFFYTPDGHKVTNLAMRCVESSPKNRPRMKLAVKYLLDLRIVRDHQMLFGDDSDKWNANLSGVKKFDFPSKGIMLDEGKTVIPYRAGLESDTRILSYEDLNLYTEGFSEENFIGKFQFGIVYHGIVPKRKKGDHGQVESQRVTVKIWEDPIIYPVSRVDSEGRLRDEIILLKHPNLISDPNVVKLMGYCYEDGKLGIVYDLHALDTLDNLLPKDSLTWISRIKVALGFARLLQFLHARSPEHQPYLVRNISAAHIMLDQDYNPNFFDFGMISGGILPDRREKVKFRRVKFLPGCYGYIDACSRAEGLWSETCDVFAFGVVLLGLITKRLSVEDDETSEEIPVHEWAWEEYKPLTDINESPCSLVHERLQGDSEFNYRDGINLTKLAMECVQYYSSARPTMKQVLRDLKKLHVVQRHAVTMGIKKGPCKNRVRGRKINPQEAMVVDS